MKLLRILLLEDSLLDAELIHAHLSEGKIDCELVRVETRLDFVAALEKDCFDLILADYALPSFDGISALEIARITCPAVPFIFVSATLGEELAIETLKSGATDYVLKQRLWRLAPSVNRALRSAKERSDRLRAEEELRQREQQFKTLAENSPDIIDRMDRGFHHVYINPAVEKATGIPAENFIGKTNGELGISEKLYLPWHQKIQQVFETGKENSFEVEFSSPSGIRHYQSRLVPEFALDGSVEFVLCISRDMTEYKLSEAALRKSEAKFRYIFESKMIGMGFWDKNGNILDVNDAFLELIGYRQSDLTDKKIHWKDITASEYIDVENWNSQEVSEFGLCGAYEKEYIRKDGSRIPVLVGGAYFEDVLEGGVFFALDLTERKELENKLRQQAEELLQANRVKDEFLAVLSHELRSPLNPIMGWAKLLRSRKFDAETTDRAIETIERNARVQVQLIEDLLDVSRIIQGKISLNVSYVNLETIIERAIETVRLAANAKAIDIIWHGELGGSAMGNEEDKNRSPSSKLLVTGDPNRLQQVVWNLLSNAVKFTPVGGRVEIKLECIGSLAQIEISDTGKGITSDFLPYVFDYFRQADSSTTRKYGGLGLGLAIVRRIAELHGGTVRAESAGEGLGATFTVQFPLVKDIKCETNSSVKSPQSIVSNPLAGVRVLVVDDDADSREFLTFVLEEYGASAMAVSSAFEGFKSLRSLKPDVLVSDIGMPEEDGYSLIRKVRALDAREGGEIPAVALTAYASYEDREKALLAGFQMHLTKPVEPAELAKVVAKLAGIGGWGDGEMGG